ncbi:MAG TPA: EVE domain-containing protein [Cytophagales bacterium]|jgi:predicted RNA-binding protein with PUA-like domain|nr:EVE domain-containing protein [Cytophagales bacterium]
MKYWLVKTEPKSYNWDDLVAKKRDHWDGVRNYQARNFMKEMKKGDEALFYHSGKKREVVGVVKIIAEAYQDPTTHDDRWVAVDVEPKLALKIPVSLKMLKSDHRFAEMLLFRNSRLSVMPVEEFQFNSIVSLGLR